MAYSIPEGSLLPWGYYVAVKTVPPGHPGVEGENGQWDVTTRTIWIDNSLPIAEQRWTFLHELDHAWNDCQLWAAQEMNIKAPQAYNEPEPETAEDS